MSSSENQNVCYPETSNLPLQSTSPQTAAQIQYRQVPYTPQRLTPQSEYQIPSQRSQHKKPAHTITLKIWQFVLCLLGAAAASPLLIIVIAGFVIMIQGYTGAVSSPTGTSTRVGRSYTNSEPWARKTNSIRGYAYSINIQVENPITPPIRRGHWRRTASSMSGRFL